MTGPVSLQIVSCVHRGFKETKYCSLCGVYVEIQGNIDDKRLQMVGIKSSRYYGQIFELKGLKVRAGRFKVRKEENSNPKFKALSKETIENLENIEEKVGISIQTTALAMYLYFVILHQKSQNEMADIGICLYLAAKYLQHTTNKTMNKIRKCFSKTFRRQQYLQKQAFILSCLDFDLSVATFIDFLLFYLSKGISFSCERLDPIRLQNKILQTAKRHLYTGTFIKNSQQKLAACILYVCRSKTPIKQIWNQPIQHYTKISEKQVHKWMGIKSTTNQVIQ